MSLATEHSEMEKPKFGRHWADKHLLRCTSWDDVVCLAKLQEVAKSKGDIFERLTQLFLLSQPEYRSKITHVWNAGSEVPPGVRRRLNLPNPDEGIDLIARTVNDTYWAIQCKYRTDTDKAVTTDDLAKFSSLAFVYCKNIELGLAVHTSTKPVKKRELLGNVVELGLGTWLELDDEGWRAIHALIGGSPIQIQRRSPREHQTAAISDAKRHFQDQQNARGLMIMPCGSGKSLTAYWIANVLGAKNIIVAVPSLSLIKQSLKDWTREYLAEGITPDWLCVCSDESVGDVEKDEFVADVYEAGIPTTTDRSKIADFLKRENSGHRIIFTTYQSSAKLAEAVGDFEFDFCVLDEAHKTVGHRKKLFATLLFDENVRVKHRLFMTATERVFQGKNDSVVSMNDDAIYGDRFHQLSFRQAIEQGIICDYKVLTVAVSSIQFAYLIEENRLLSDENQSDREWEAKSLAAGVALLDAFEKHDIKHAISFHRSIRTAKEFREQQDKLNTLQRFEVRTDNFHVSSKQSAGERVELMHEFVRHDRSLMTNARCLTEGVDIPAVDCVLFADPKGSIVDIVQAAGRAMRPNPNAGKKFGYILLPIIVSDGMGFDEFSETTEYQTIARTIAALSTQDERIAEEFRATTEGRQASDKIIKIEGHVPVGFELNFDAFAAAVHSKLWEKIGKVNWRPFGQAREYTRRFKFGSRREWEEHARSGFLPPDIPATPQSVYEKEGWSGWGDWLGTSTVAPQLREYLAFEAAREHARRFGFESRMEWNAYAKSGKLPPNIPATPWQIYADDGWISLGDWLGTDTVASHLRRFMPFKKARKYVHRLGLKSTAEWRAYAQSGQRPMDIPAIPHRTYKTKGWVSMGDWLGTGFVAHRNRKYRTFAEAREFARSLQLKTLEEWIQFTQSGKLPADIPAIPAQQYKGRGWKGVGDWLGTGRIANQQLRFRKFEEGRAYARRLGLTSGTHWRQFVASGQLPKDIPKAPHLTYRARGWMGWGDWLGTNRVAVKNRTFRSFEAAKSYVRELGLHSYADWRVFAKSGKLPLDIPTNPNRTYRDFWIGWGDWLGTNEIAPTKREFLPFVEARNFARGLGLKSQMEWRNFTKSNRMPTNIPTAPNQVYKGQGWLGYGDWLGTGRIANQNKRFLSFGEAKKFVHELSLKSVAQWRAFVRDGKLPVGIPATPNQVYLKDGWAGWEDWLGKSGFD